jgi:hypothetical protein
MGATNLGGAWHYSPLALCGGHGMFLNICRGGLGSFGE